MRFSELAAGYEIAPITVALDAETVQRYLAATGDDTDTYWRDGELRLVPPLAVVAFVIGGMMRQLTLEPGSLHAGQELTVRRPIVVGERLVANARVASSSKRRGFTAMAIDMAVTDDLGEEALTGRMTLLVGGADAGVAVGDAAPMSLSWPPELVPPRPVAYAPLPRDRIAPGAPLPSLERTLTQQTIDAYAVASGDHNPIHVDPSFAATTPFGGTIAHGMLLLAYISTALTRAFGLAWLNTGSLRVKFRNPGLSGATVTVSGSVERIEESDSVQYAVCAVALETASGDGLITGDARVEQA